MRMVEAANVGYLPHPRESRTRHELRRCPIATGIISQAWFTNSLPAGTGGVGSNIVNQDIREPTTRMIDHLGTSLNPDNFVPTERDINGLKGLIFDFQAPMAERSFLRTVRDAATGLAPASVQEIATLFDTVSLIAL